MLELTPEREDILQRIGSFGSRDGLYPIGIGMQRNSPLKSSPIGSRDGLLTEALDAYNTLASRHPSDPQWPARIAELRGARGGAKTAPTGPPALPSFDAAAP